MEVFFLMLIVDVLWIFHLYGAGDQKVLGGGGLCVG